MILHRCRVGLVVWGIRYLGCNQCLVRFHTGTSFRHWSAFDQLSIRCCAEKEKWNSLSHVVDFSLQTMCRVPTCSISLCRAGEVWLFHCKSSSFRQAHNRFGSCNFMAGFRATSSASGHCGFYHQGTNVPTWISRTNACQGVHSQHCPHWLAVFGNLMRLRKSAR